MARSKPSVAAQIRIVRSNKAKNAPKNQLVPNNRRVVGAGAAKTLKVGPASAQEAQHKLKPAPATREAKTENGIGIQDPMAAWGTHFIGPDRVAVHPCKSKVPTNFPGQDKIIDNLPAGLLHRIADLKALETRKPAKKGVKTHMKCCCEQNVKISKMVQLEAALVVETESLWPKPRRVAVRRKRAPETRAKKVVFISPLQRYNADRLSSRSIMANSKHVSNGISQTPADLHRDPHYKMQKSTPYQAGVSLSTQAGGCQQAVG
jgi:hypothetical protein